MNVVSNVSNVSGSSRVDPLEARILEIFSVYPRISPTMLQSALGPSLSPELWRPILERLIREDLIDHTAELPPVGSKRTRAYTVLELRKTDRKTLEAIKVPAPPK